MSQSKESIEKKAANSIVGLDDIRTRISQVDQRLLSLLNERRQLSESVVKEKRLINKPLRDQQREQALLQSLVAKAANLGLEPHYITRLFNLIIEDSVQFQQDYLQSLSDPVIKSTKGKILAVLGGKGAYSHLAAKKYFSKSENNYVACESFEQVLARVQTNEVDFGVIPIENTTSGGITEVYDLLLDSNLSIIGEEKYAVNHCLVAAKNSQLDSITTIVAHPQASRQCSENLKTLKNAEIKLVQSTAHALENVLNQKSTNIAAVASEEAASLFELAVLKKNLANQSENITRFLVLSLKPIEVAQGVQCKTSIALSTGQKAGSLAEVLGLFKEANIPLTKLESRPIPNKPWEQMFYIDFEGNIADQKVKSALTALSKLCRFMKLLGSYPTKDISATRVPAKSLASAKLQLNESRTSDSLSLATSNQGDTESVTGNYPTANHQLTSRNHKSSDSIVQIGNCQIGANGFNVLAGPTAVESETQILSCAKLAREIGISILTAGCFKPQSSPECFQQLGVKGVDYLKLASQKHALAVMTEITNQEELNLAVKQLDLVRIGASNMQNFSLLKSVGQVNHPVMLVRDPNASIDEFLNAADYILAQGNLQVILCEQGSRVAGSNKTILDLSTIPLLKTLTHLPIIIDPNHAALDSNFIFPIVRAAKAMGVHGVLIEFQTETEVVTDNSQHLLSNLQLTKLMAEI